MRLIDQLQYALKPELEIRAIPNGGYRTRTTAMSLKAEGVKAGTPDLVICLPQGKVGWLEMKTAIGSLSQEQKNFRDKVRRLDHLWEMARSVDEAMDVLTNWDALKPEYRTDNLTEDMT